MAGWAAKRFWTEVQVVREPGGFGIGLDNRRVKTPAKAPLLVPTMALAQAIAAEWQAQQGTIDPTSMPFTRSANSAIDKVAPQRAEVTDLIADYADADLICYRATAPDRLIRRQAAAWARLTELSVELDEERRVDADAAPAHRADWLLSVASMRASALRRPRSIRPAGILSGSVTKPARTTASRSLGVSTSSSAAVHIRLASIRAPYPPPGTRSANSNAIHPLDSTRNKPARSPVAALGINPDRAPDSTPTSADSTAHRGGPLE